MFQPAPQLSLSRWTVRLAGETDFAGWRDAARRLVLNEIAPEEIAWTVVPWIAPAMLPLLTGPSPRTNGAVGHVTPTPDPSPQGGGRPLPLGSAESSAVEVQTLPPQSPSPLRGGVRGGGKQPSSDHRLAERPPEIANVPELPPLPRGAELRVSREFVSRAETVFCHADPERFGFLYRMLSRLRAEPKLMEIASDSDLRRFEAMEKAVRRDIHKMRAFVRFRRIGEEPDERYVAWFEPEHHIVERNAPFFMRRFTGMRWTILTPRVSADWDGEALTIGPGAAKRDAPAEDGAEDLWRTYFENIFNPARLKVKAMQAEMPKKYWRNLPEASLIPALIAGAEGATREMIARSPTAPAPHHAKVQARHWPASPEAEMSDDGADAATIEALAAAARGCRRCPLWRDATQTVFGEGPERARVIFVGEQPGDQEDIAGRPFVGPAGRIFDETLEQAGLDRTTVYVTNAVKHFKFEPRGKRRLHKKPNAGEVQACRWWMDKELAIIKPDLVVALGATAALSLLGKAIPVTQMRGQAVVRDDGLRVFLTIHPSFILRIREPEDREAERGRFLADLQAVRGLMAG